MAPASSRMGAALSSMGRSVPSRAMRTVWFASPTIVPSRKARRAGFSTGWRVRSLTMWKTSGRGRPTASAWVQPVRDSATPFKNVTRPSASVLITASPMLASVIRSHSDCFRNASSARHLRGEEDAPGVLRRDGTRRSSFFLVRRINPLRLFPTRVPCRTRRMPGCFERRVAGRGRVVAERRETAVVRRARPECGLSPCAGGLDSTSLPIARSIRGDVFAAKMRAVVRRPGGRYDGCRRGLPRGLAGPDGFGPRCVPLISRADVRTPRRNCPLAMHRESWLLLNLPRGAEISCPCSSPSARWPRS